MNVIIVHGAYGYPGENWFTWLKTELEIRSIHCCVPALPTPNNQHLTTWLNKFEMITKDFITPDTVLIGHSLGATFILRWLEKYFGKLKSVILVGAFIYPVGIKHFDDINQSFINSSFNWEKITSCCSQFVSFYGSNDEYVKKDEFEFIAQQLNAKRIVISNGGHLNTKAGYDRFPHLLRYVRNLVVARSAFCDDAI